MDQKMILGPCRILVGNPTEAAGAGMHDLGHTRGDVVVNPQNTVAMARSDQIGAIPHAGSVYTSGVQPVVTAPVYEQTKERMRLLLPGSELVTNTIDTTEVEALAFGALPGRIAMEDIPTMALIPLDQIEDGVDAEDAIWLPAMIVRNGGSWTFNLPEGEDAGNPRSVEVAGLYRPTDQADADIPVKARVGFLGSPNVFDLGWSLPDLTTG